MVRLVNGAEAAKILNCSRHTLAIWRLHGVGPRFVKIGGRISYDVNDLNDYINSCKFDSTSEYRGEPDAHAAAAKRKAAAAASKNEAA